MNRKTIDTDFQLRTFGLVAVAQFLAKNLDQMTISRETLQAIWPVDRWTQARVDNVKATLHWYFPSVSLKFYSGRLGEPGFDGFTVSGLIRSKARRAKKKIGALQLRYSIADCDPAGCTRPQFPATENPACHHLHLPS